MSIRTNVKTGNEYFHARLGLPLGRWAQQETQQKYSTPKPRLICKPPFTTITGNGDLSVNANASTS